MARRVLSGWRWQWLWFALALASCRRDEHAPAPSASVSAAGTDFTIRARERHLQEELTRATARWESKPTLGDCASALKEKPDLELCQAAERALAAVTDSPPASPEIALTRLTPAALALTRLGERLRYLSLQELAERRLERDAGAAPTPSASGSLDHSGPPHAPPEHAHAEQRALQLSEGPISRQLEVALRLEREVIRNLGAYLEYGPLSVRRAAYEASRDLRAQHPRWPALDHLLNEATVLETDTALKRDLQQLSANGRPADGRPSTAQSAGAK